jgi:hypothetical protein
VDAATVIAAGDAIGRGETVGVLDAATTGAPMLTAIGSDSSDVVKRPTPYKKMMNPPQNAAKITMNARGPM